MANTLAYNKLAEVEEWLAEEYPNAPWLKDIRKLIRAWDVEPKISVRHVLPKIVSKAQKDPNLCYWNYICDACEACGGKWTPDEELPENSAWVFSYNEHENPRVPPPFGTTPTPKKFADLPRMDELRAIRKDIEAMNVRLTNLEDISRGKH